MIATSATGLAVENCVTEDLLVASVADEVDASANSSSEDDSICSASSDSIYSTCFGEARKMLPKSEGVHSNSANDLTIATLEISESESVVDGDHPVATCGGGPFSSPGSGVSLLHESGVSLLHGSSSSSMRLSMCGGLYDSSAEGGGGGTTGVATASPDAVADAEESEAAGHRPAVHRRASNPIALVGGRRSSLGTSRRDSVISTSMREAFQQLREDFEHKDNAGIRQAPSGERLVQEKLTDSDSDDCSFNDYYGYGDAVPDNRQPEADAATPSNRKSSIGHRLESVHHASMQEAFHQVCHTFESQRTAEPNDGTGCGHGDDIPDLGSVDCDHEDANPEDQLDSPLPSNVPPCVEWDVQEEDQNKDDEAAKYGYGDDHGVSRRSSGAHYDYGYGIDDHDMESTWYKEENMGRSSDRVPPHRDPAVAHRNRRTRKERQGSWHAQEQPRRRVQRRSSVTKYSLEESFAKVRREDELLAAAASADDKAACLVTPQQKKKRSIARFLPSPASFTNRRPKLKESRKVGSQRSQRSLRTLLHLGGGPKHGGATAADATTISDSASLRSSEFFQNPPPFSPESRPVAEKSTNHSFRRRRWFGGKSSSGRSLCESS